MTDAAGLIATTLTHHAGLRHGEWRLPALAAARLAPATAEAITDRAAIEQRIAELDGTHNGWCRRESWIGRTPCAAAADLGPPLDGEWVAADGQSSLRLVFVGGAWRLHMIAERDDGSPVLREDMIILGQGGVPLRYAVYWAGPPGDPAGLRRLACRLVGFGWRGEQ